jgi:hypothetical protein
VDLEGKAKEADKKAQLIKRDIEKRLDNMQAMVHKSTSGREKTDEEYLQSLRLAYEASSEDEDSLAARALANKRQSLKKVREEWQRECYKNQQKQYIKQGYPSKPIAKVKQDEFEEDREEEDEEELSRLPPHKNMVPIKTILETRSDEKKRFNEAEQKHKSKKANNIATEPSPFPSIIPMPNNRDYRMDTSDEDVTPHIPQTLHQQPRFGAKEPPLDELDETQLRQIKALVDQRLAEQGRAMADDVADDPPRIDDDFYDAKFLDLVYEMESQKDERSM